MDFKIAPSILAADFLHLEKDIRLVNECGDVIHLDVMDGTFVPNISFGFSVIDHVAKIATAPMDVHLMVVHPERWFEKIASEGAAYCSFHLETAGDDTADFLGRIRSLGMKAGLAVNPDVPVEKLYPYIGQADYFLIMSVFAGFGGQKFIPESLERVAALHSELEKRGDGAFIEIDGGIKLSNVRSVRDAGVSLAVAGSSVYGAEDPAAAIKALREA
ncbi:MAG TPA: ribulose-phosphate 3-epimerase [Candidatus Cryptobacteroides merdipullorum]|uniref:Ribulose-phosphate 3-epimerase n=1 Tax=Candidatus Cryptobacteroides merdipullorum TaxID=2840771 RepID=A0A9D1KGY0_9BACT|nr:ribulose-phosphate 3-epimerase [Candidatus Cryptobacteroides merdipullorum]